MANMNRSKKRLSHFLAALNQLTRPYSVTEDEGIRYWRERILYAILLVAIVAGFFATISGVSYTLREGLWGIAAIDTVAYLLVVGLFIFRRGPFLLRGGCSILIFYLIGLYLFIRLGLLGSGLVWLFMFPVAAAIFFGLRAGLAAIAINVLTLTILDPLLVSERLSWPFPPHTIELQRLLVVEGDFIFLCIIATASIGFVLNRLQASLESEKKVRGTLEAEVAERKNLEAALRESEEKYRTYFESVSDVIFTVDTDFLVTGVSPSVKRQIGYSPEEVIGKPFYELNILAPEYLEKAFSDTLRVFEGNWVETVYEFIAKDGTRKFGEIHGAPLWQGGKVVGSITVGRDITELKQMWDALEQSVNRFKETVELLPSIVLEMDLDMQISYSNSLGFETFGYTQEDIESGLNALDLVHPEDKHKVRNAFEKLKNEAHVEPIAIRLIAKNGTEMTAMVNSTLIYQGDKKTGIRSSVTDITAQRKMEEELFKAKQFESLGTLTGGIAHDFNNLLTAILGNISLAQMHKPDDKILKLLKEAEIASLQAKELTHRLLTLTKGGEPVKKRCDIERIVRASVPRGGRQDIKFNFSLPEGLWPGHVDAEQIQQVFENVITNAIEAIKDRGVITISGGNMTINKDSNLAVTPGQYVKITITDTGVGIPETLRPRIFDPYFSTKQLGTQKGMGLGLSLTLSILRKHGGFIIIESKPGEGTTASIYLPAFRAP